MHPARSTRALWLVAALALAFTAVSCSDESPSLQGIVRTPPLEVGSVALPAATGEAAPVALVAPPGELYVVYFGYTSCPDVCPTTMSDLSVALDDLPDQLADRVTVAMVTVDPERDTDEVLSSYLGHFFDRSLPLRTADPAGLRAATSAFGVQVEIEEHAPGEAYDVAHTAVTYVVDDRGVVVVEWPFGSEPASMTADLTTLLREERT